MNKILGWLGDRVQVSTGEGTSNVLDTFVDDDGSVIAVAETDPRHPANHGQEKPGLPRLPGDDPEDVVESGEEGQVG